MAVIRPFRAWRADVSRLDPGILAFRDDDGDEAFDPRTLRHALRSRRLPADAEDVAATRARFHVAELIRSGLLKRERTPALYVLRGRSGERVWTGFFAAARVHDLPVEVDVDVDAAWVSGGVTGDAFVLGFTDKRGRVARGLQTETEREPDASFACAGCRYELWVVDDETTAERWIALVQAGDPRVRGGHRALATLRGAHPATQTAVDDDAAAFGLGFFVDGDGVGVEVDVELPTGVVLLPRTGAL